MRMESDGSYMPPAGIETYTLTKHAVDAMRRRGLNIDHVHGVLRHPEQRYRVRAGRDVFQSRVRGARGTYLLRVFVDVDLDPPRVVTAYRTSRIGKYWR